jgi:high-affinity iron transporter
MLPTFVIGLREGLEAALIVGIVAAFLRQRGRRDLLRWAFVGVGAAIGLCLAIGIALDVISHELPQRQQEGLETVIGACAVAMVTYMVIWMRRHSRTLKAQLEGAADHALAAGSGFALVLMAFLAVLREGLETVVFLLAAFNQSGNTGLAATGALLGVIVAVILGWGIYRGGVRLNLSKFFRFTGIVLTFVAAGLVVSALHTAHEAGWLTIGQQSTVDLSALVRPGSVQAALLTGMLGVQPFPVLIEVIGWLVYLVPVLLYVAIPPSANPRRLSNPAARRLFGAVGAVAVVAAILLAVLMPGRPAHDPVTRSPDGVSAQLVSKSATGAVIAATVVHPGSTGSASSSAGVQALSTHAQGQSNAGGATADVYTVTTTGLTAGGPSTLTYADLSERNGGRLPLGVRVTDASQSVPVREQYSDVGTFWVDPTTRRVVDVEWHETTTLVAQLSIGPSPIGSPAVATWQLPEPTALSAARAARDDRQTIRQRSLLGALAVTALLIAGVCAVFIAGLALASRRHPITATEPATTESAPVNVQPDTPRSALLKS